MLQFTYVVRPGEAPEGRGPQFEPFWDLMMNFNLRIGFLVQLASYCGFLALISSTGSSPLSLLSFLKADLQTIGDVPTSLIMLCCGGFIFGNLLNMAYLHICDDDSSIKQSRGYRSGTKFLVHATALGALCWTFSLMGFFSNTYYLEDAWMKQQIGGGSQWLMYFSSRIFDLISLLLYSLSAFFLETYHSEGAGEAWGWICSVTFKLTAISELVALLMLGSDGFVTVDAVFTVLLGASLTFSTLWAFIFEPISHRYDVKLTQSAMRNEYYKSRNAMAYFGPATVNADGEIDIAAATQQAQASFNCA